MVGEAAPFLGQEGRVVSMHRAVPETEGSRNPLRKGSDPMLWKPRLRIRARCVLLGSIDLNSPSPGSGPDDIHRGGLRGSAMLPHDNIR